MNRIDLLFQTKKEKILTVYFTAGFPKLDDTVEIMKQLEKKGVDMIEIGMPFSDPLADGPVIQQSSQKALENGMSLKILFQQLKDIRKEVQLPLILFGYLNPVLQYGFDKFCNDAAGIGIDGLILPDLPLDEYQKYYRKPVEKNDLRFIFLISPETSPERIRLIDKTGSGFNYIVSSSSTTGAKDDIIGLQTEYFKRIQSMKLKNPSLIGFGISNRQSFVKACQFANGVIIGSAFIKALSEKNDVKTVVANFVKNFKE